MPFVLRYVSTVLKEPYFQGNGADALGCLPLPRVPLVFCTVVSVQRRLTGALGFALIVLCMRGLSMEKDCGGRHNFSATSHCHSVPFVAVL